MSLCLLLLMTTHCTFADDDGDIRPQAYLDDFDKFCQKLGGATAEIMGDLLSFEVRVGPGPAVAQRSMHGGLAAVCSSVE